MSADDQDASDEEDTVGIDVDADDLETVANAVTTPDADADETEDADTDENEDTDDDSDVNDEERHTRLYRRAANENGAADKTEAVVDELSNVDISGSLEAQEAADDAVTVLEPIADRGSRGVVVRTAEDLCGELASTSGARVDGDTWESWLVDPLRNDVDDDDAEARAKDVVDELTQDTSEPEPFLGADYAGVDWVLEHRVLRVERTDTTDHVAEPRETVVLATEPVMDRVDESSDLVDVDPDDVETIRLPIDGEVKEHYAVSTTHKWLDAAAARLDHVPSDRVEGEAMFDDVIAALSEEFDGDDVEFGSPKTVDSLLGSALAHRTYGPSSRIWSEATFSDASNQLFEERRIVQDPRTGPRTEAWDALKEEIQSSQITSDRRAAVEEELPYYDEDDGDVWVPVKIINKIVDDLPIDRRDLNSEIKARKADTNALSEKRMSEKIALGQRAWRLDPEHEDMPDVDPDTVTDEVNESHAESFFNTADADDGGDDVVNTDDDADEQGGDDE